ncbi:MAG: DUF4249 family protein, partial [Bacteroidota bacterium]
MKPSINLYTFFLALILLGFTTGCYKEVVVPLPEHEVRLVSNCLVQSGFPFQVFVSRSFGMSEEVNEIDIYLEDARVELWREGELEEVLKFEREAEVFNPVVFSSYGYFSEHLAQPGATYELRVSHPDYPTLTQTMRMPIEPTFTNPIFSPSVGFNEEGERIQRLEATLSDEAGVPNYYSLWSRYVAEPIDTNQASLPINNIPVTWDPLPVSESRRLNSYFQATVLKDENFDGQQVQVRFEEDFLDDFIREPGYEDSYILLE